MCNKRDAQCMQHSDTLAKHAAATLGSAAFSNQLNRTLIQQLKGGDALARATREGSKKCRDNAAWALSVLAVPTPLVSAGSCASRGGGMV